MVTLLYSVLHLCSVPSGCRYTGERPGENKKNADIEGKAGRVSRDRQLGDVRGICGLWGCFPQFI